MASSRTIRSTTLPIIWLVTALLSSLHQAEGALQVGYYDSTCSSAESTVKSVVQSAYSSDNTIAASLIRLHFHDCFVNGCDASIMLNGSGTEQSAFPNQSIRGYYVITNAKTQLEAACPGVVSCADIIALAARDALYILGGPSYSAETGRFDGTSPGDTSTLPVPNSTVSEATPFFTKQGLTQEDMVNLIGAHTVGVAQCQFFVDRLYNYKGTGAADPSLDSTYLAALQSKCPNVSNGKTNVQLDVQTEFSFDTAYYQNLQANKGLLRIDQEVGNDASTSGRVNTLASSYSTFSTDFVNSIISMGKIGVLTSGTVRSVCETT